MSKLRIAAMEGDALRVSALLESDDFRPHYSPPWLEDLAEALLLASARGHQAVVEMLVQAGAPVNRIFPGGTALHAAVMGDYPDVVSTLLQAGAEPDVTDRQLGSRQQGWTALMYAACYGRTAIAHQLLQAGCQSDLADRDGQTPLMIAANAGHTAVALLLLESGAELNTRDYYGNTALACALAHDAEGTSLAASLAEMAEVNLESLAPLESLVSYRDASYQVIAETRARPWNWGSAPSAEGHSPSPSAAIAQTP